jgi:hypothetical protein
MKYRSCSGRFQSPSQTNRGLELLIADNKQSLFSKVASNRSARRNQFRTGRTFWDVLAIMAVAGDSSLCDQTSYTLQAKQLLQQRRLKEEKLEWCESKVSGILEIL